MTKTNKTLPTNHDAQKALLFIFKLFFSWRVLLFVFLFLSLRLVPLQENFLGGGLQSYIDNPYLWSWINFDGEHYLSIARRGYQDLTYFYFPLFPLLVSLFSNIIGDGFRLSAIVGLVIANSALLVGLVGLLKLFALDHKRTVTKTAVSLLLIFPTSFYFGSFYTESLFFALTVWSFYLARNKRYILAGTLGGLSTATRIVGLALIPALAAEYFFSKDNFTTHDSIITTKNIVKLFSLLLVPTGLVAYMFFLNTRTGDPLEFFNSLSGVFGQQRVGGFVLLPQVFYRYLFKILPNINYDYFPVVFTTFLELAVAISFLVLSIYSFFKSRLSYALFLTLGYLIPTFSGSFSSLPRYVLVLFPAFIIVAEYLNDKKKNSKYVFYAISLVLLGIASSLFLRGYWVS